ncbi:hypothetical protein KO561_05855 [Radiobacillus kanasensis]|uniref:hypothetical protein n=1 Tax=Radiobacillus kanasensis TaxID=2844358 RepID=UPI001E401CF6|nr:hypothetical protein [Radiobacillus kanasensis]UFU00464.1 hypothetical protein KO561_05855 [Radiobacillus kanasensis]
MVKSCPLCNGLEQFEMYCTNCGENMDDVGRAVDYHSDYSPYLDYQITNTVDGADASDERNVCMHLFICPTCSHQLTKGIGEK